MNPQNLSLCKKAGKLVCGFDAVVKELSLKKTQFLGVFTVSDISFKTFKELCFFADKYFYEKEIIKTTFTFADTEKILKKRIAVMAVTDKNLFEMIIGNKQ